MSNHNAEFALILNQKVKLTRRSGYSTTDMGQRRASGETIVVAEMPVFFYMNVGRYSRQLPGDVAIGDYTMMVMPDQDIQVGDLVYPVSGVAGLTLGQVLNVMAYPDFAGLTHHVDVQVKRL